MGFPILVRQHLYIESGPWWSLLSYYSGTLSSLSSQWDAFEDLVPRDLVTIDIIYGCTIFKYRKKSQKKLTIKMGQKDSRPSDGCWGDITHWLGALMCRRHSIIWSNTTGARASPGMIIAAFVSSDFIATGKINSLWLSGVICQHGFGPTLAQVMAPSHYLNKCWLSFNMVLCLSFQCNVYFNTQDINPQVVFIIYTFEITATFLRRQWVNLRESIKLNPTTQ